MPRKPSAKKHNKNGPAVIYARYSSHNQKDASIEQQVAACLKYASELGLTVIDSYADRAVTGKTDKRPQFQKLMKDAANGRFDYVLAWKSNRIGRNMLQALQNAQRLNEYGVQVFYAEEHFEDNAAGRFALRSMMNMNQFYSENMAEDIQRGLLDNARQCKVCGAIPFGYKVSKDHKYEIDEPRAAVVREIFQHIADGKQISQIVRDLNERGIRNRLGRPFNNNSFTGILENERYRGIYIYKDIRIPGGVPRIISDDLFFKVQEALRMKKNPRYTGRRKGSVQY
ncbi:MAG: recombinase family protein, partial [Acidaminococcaceae bacterium]|nr:recombinase family protein [Acidaminococcaceae bacterium]